MDTANVNVISELPLQRVIVDRRVSTRPLYWRVISTDLSHAVTLSEGQLCMSPGTAVSFDAYFNACFEHQWRAYTTAAHISLSVQTDRPCLVRVFRAVATNPPVLLHEARLEQAGGTEFAIANDITNFRQAGRLYFELTAGADGVRLLAAEWRARAAAPRPVGLALVFCTFNREADIARALQAVADDALLLATLARVIVVNQGRRRLGDHPQAAAQIARLGGSVRVFDQDNHGGAGGFGRGLLEASQDPAVSHVAFVDDDVLIEPESLLRMARFFALARADVALGGHMLDRVQPTRLYEAGAVLSDKWALKPLRHDQDLADAATLGRLTDIQPMHYNGWWLFGFPLSLVDALGMPLSCFIRGDDVEFGLRLHRHAKFTVTLPGVAVWHEPFYLKIGGWQLYYETRNLLVAAALHLPFSGRRVAEMMGKRLLMELLTFRYYNASLILAGIRDFRQGPAILRQPAQPIHAGLDRLRQAHPAATIPREAVLAPAPVAGAPRSKAGFVLAMLRTLADQWMRPSAADAVPGRLDVRDLVWFRVAHMDGLAVDTHWDRDLQLFRRDQAQFRTLATAAWREVAALWREAPALSTAWQRALPDLSSKAHWRRYLGLAKTAAPGSDENRKAVARAPEASLS